MEIKQLAGVKEEDPMPTGNKKIDKRHFPKCEAILLAPNGKELAKCDRELGHKEHHRDHFDKDAYYSWPQNENRKEDNNLQ